MRAPLVEAGCTLRRLARRRTAPATIALAAALLGYAAVVNPVVTARDALSAATAIAAIVVLVLATGIVGDDRERGRLALAATHPSPPWVWVVGRWLADDEGRKRVAAAGRAYAHERYSYARMVERMLDEVSKVSR